MLGLKSNKDWVLLANYRDPTFMMNPFAFELADYLGMPFANNTRFCDVTLNGKWIGLYHLTEQIETGGNRVDIDEETDVLLTLDTDDAGNGIDGNQSNAPGSFRSDTYGLPVCIKSPKDELLPATKKAEIRADFKQLEDLIKAHNYSAVKARLDLRSLMNFLLIQELTMNVELSSPRSMFMYRTADQVWHFGPPWDFDAGFCFDWGQMMTGHNYFGNYTSLILGSNPASSGSVSAFFRDMFKDARFVSEYKAYWNMIREQLLPQTFAKLENYRHQIETSMEQNYTLWHAADPNFNKQFATEYPRLLQWITNRFNVVNNAINNYPDQN
jgi:spore coat protein CotH